MLSSQNHGQSSGECSPPPAKSKFFPTALNWAVFGPTACEADTLPTTTTTTTPNHVGGGDRRIGSAQLAEPISALSSLSQLSPSTPLGSSQTNKSDNLFHFANMAQQPVPSAGTQSGSPIRVTCPRPGSKKVEWHSYCTHTTVTRVFTQNDVCDYCSLAPPWGWLYQCTDDVELELEPVGASAEGILSSTPNTLSLDDVFGPGHKSGQRLSTKGQGDNIHLDVKQTEQVSLIPFCSTASFFVSTLLTREDM